MALQLGLFYKYTARGSIKISRYQAGAHLERRARSARLCGSKPRRVRLSTSPAAAASAS